MQERRVLPRALFPAPLPRRVSARPAVRRRAAAEHPRPGPGAAALRGGNVAQGAGAAAAQEPGLHRADRVAAAAVPRGADRPYPRDPRAVFASSRRSLAVVLHEMSLQDAQVDVGEIILETYPRVLDRLLAETRGAPPSCFASVSLEALTQDPAAEMRRIWHQLKLPGPEASLAAIDGYLSAVRGIARATTPSATTICPRWRRAGTGSWTCSRRDPADTFRRARSRAPHHSYGWTGAIMILARLACPACAPVSAAASCHAGDQRGGSRQGRRDGTRDAGQAHERFFHRAGNGTRFGLWMVHAPAAGRAARCASKASLAGPGAAATATTATP